jgi:hypothetical protein
VAAERAILRIVITITMFSHSIPFTGESSLVQKQFSNSPNTNSSSLTTMSSKDDYKDSFPYFESDNYHGWFIQFKSSCRGIGAHIALNTRSTHPVDANGNPQILSASQTRNCRRLGMNMTTRCSPPS